ncbi:alcohol dehydrogenase catalytic domain-containing protein [candidate division KSB3 bacterium]|uniref:Alcohol dehydrogenase catalytic domain-containing protein n=1 Tax=candidate division KSB3 bacterium TaxID=2044937 RepID=A0A9D5JXY8_9BACT|nr:alcohol dehydrogenase catalytic domain-containing protein [candidate division KSB3 bacterium]MBD3325882.1 alcohol dehydrogenase catalytic domain-containing protein [candidate division KSB3 bacterium]
MKALVKYERGPGNMEIRDVPEPEVKPGEVKIQVHATGICGSDLHIYHDDAVVPISPPVITGHEFAGVVAEVGEGITEWKAGDRVVSETAYDVCGACEPCMTGFYNLCPQRKTLGFWANGAFTSYTVVPAHRVHALPDNVDFVAGSLMEPLACVVHAALELTQITTGDLVLVSGPGAIGLSAIQIAKAQGARVIAAGTDMDLKRLELARELGADMLINVMQRHLLDEVNTLTQGRGVDIVLECSGSAQAANDAVLAVKRRGQYTQIGLFGKPITIDMEKMCFKEIRFIGSLASKWTSWEKALQLVAQGRVQLKPLVSDVLPIRDWETAFQMFEDKQGLKIVLTPEN